MQRNLSLLGDKVQHWLKMADKIKMEDRMRHSLIVFLLLAITGGTGSAAASAIWPYDYNYDSSKPLVAICDLKTDLQGYGFVGCGPARCDSAASDDESNGATEWEKALMGLLPLLRLEKTAQKAFEYAVSGFSEGATGECRPNSGTRQEALAIVKAAQAEIDDLQVKLNAVRAQGSDVANAKTRLRQLKADYEKLFPEYEKYEKLLPEFKNDMAEYDKTIAELQEIDARQRLNSGANYNSSQASNDLNARMDAQYKKLFYENRWKNYVSEFEFIVEQMDDLGAMAEQARRALDNAQARQKSVEEKRAKIQAQLADARLDLADAQAQSEAAISCDLGWGASKFAWRQIGIFPTVPPYGCLLYQGDDYDFEGGHWETWNAPVIEFFTN